MWWWVELISVWTVLAFVCAPIFGAWLGRRACDTVCYFTAAELEQLRRRFD